MAKYRPKQKDVEAVQINDVAELLGVEKNSWLITEASGKQRVVSDDEFKRLFEPANTEKDYNKLLQEIVTRPVAPQPFVTGPYISYSNKTANLSTRLD